MIQILYKFVNPKKELSSTYLNDAATSISNTFHRKTVFSQQIDEENFHLSFENEISSNTGIFLSIQSFNGIKELSIQIDTNFDIKSGKFNLHTFDDTAYELKVLIKDLLRKDWWECIWLYDSQAAYYSNELYSVIYQVENALRNFINNLMIKAMGIGWWDTYIKNNLQDTSKKREDHYRKIAPSYRNVDTNLLSINTDDLTEIMKFKVKKWNPVFSTDIQDLILYGKEKDLLSLQGKLRNQTAIETDLWDSFFSNYFEDAFVSIWEEFCKNRNHIAHNKLLDKDAYETIKQNANQVIKEIGKANMKFQQETISDEQKVALQALEQKRTKIINMDASDIEQGLHIWDEKKIRVFFEQEFSELATKLQEKYMNRKDLAIDFYGFNVVDDQKFFSIKSLLLPHYANFEYSFNIKSEQAATSTAMLSIEVQGIGKTHFSYNMSFSNGIDSDNKSLELSATTKTPRKMSLETQKIIEDLTMHFSVVFHK